MKRNFKILSLLTIVVVLASCSSAQYGYDDVYNHDYPVAVAKTKVDNSTNQEYYDDNASSRNNNYQEEDYNNYNSSSNYGNSGYYSNRIERFYRPSFSISYFSNGFSTYGYGNNNYYNNNYYYNSSPFFGYNPFFTNSYDWHIHHYHNAPLWGNYYSGFGYNNYSPWFGGYGYNNYCGNNFGYNNYYPNYNPFYGHNDGYQPNTGGNSIYYGPRSNYSKPASSADPQIQINYGNDGQIKNETKTFSNGVQVKTDYKPNTTTPTPNIDNNNDNNPPVVVPRYNNNPAPTVTPKPAYNQPKSTPKPSYEKPKSTPRPSYSTPKPTVKPSGNSSTQPKTNQSSGVKVKTTKKE